MKYIEMLYIIIAIIVFFILEGISKSTFLLSSSPIEIYTFMLICGIIFVFLYKIYSKLNLIINILKNIHKG